MRLNNGYELIIEPVQPEDAAEVVAYLNMVGGETHNLTFGKDEFPFQAEEEKVFIENLQKQSIDQMWKGVVDGKIVSVCNFTSFTKKREAHRGSFGISVAKSHWQLGIAKHMLTHLLDYVKTKPQIKVIGIEVITDNEAAIHLYTSFGFHIEGCFHKFTCVDGAYLDAYYMEKLL